MAAVVALAGVAGVSAASAEALSPWWHLTSGSRPSALPVAGTAVDDVQEITISATSGDFYVEDPATGKNDLVSQLPYDATAAQVRAVLEKYIYPGRVLSVEENRERDTSETHIYVVTFPAQAVVAMSAKSFFLAQLKGGREEASARVLSEGKSGGEVIDTAIDVGNGPTNECVQVAAGAGKYTSATCETEAGAGKGEFDKEPVRLVDELPAGLRAVAASIITDGQHGDDRSAGSCSVLAPRQVECTPESALTPFAQFEVRIGVAAEPGAVMGETNEVSVSGGSAPRFAIKRPTAIGGPVPFGVEDYELSPEEQRGGADTQAGSHPFQLTTTFTFNQTASTNSSQSISGPYEASPVALAKDLRLKFPAGLIGNPTGLTQCTQLRFLSETCPAGAAVGVATTTIDEGGVLGLATFTSPVYNLEPNVGEPALFGFLPTKQAPAVFLKTSVRTGEDYGITVSIDNITQSGALISGTVTLWGEPGASSHDNQRTSGCLQGESSSCEVEGQSEAPPFLSMPVSCTGPLQSAIEVDSWVQPGSFVSTPAAAMGAMDSCNQLPFKPLLTVTPDVQQASEPSGLSVDLHIPPGDAPSPDGLPESPLKEMTIALPEGVTINPAAAGGTETCSEALVGFTGFGPPPAPPGGSGSPGSSGGRAVTFTPTLPGAFASSEPLEPGVNFCANMSKIGKAVLETPLLAGPIEGAVYLARETENPFGSLLALYIAAENYSTGTVVKLAGDVSLNPATGQITVRFEGTPQLPLEDIELSFYAGERALLSTPAHCGTYTTQASLVPWSGHPPGRDLIARREHISG